MSILEWVSHFKNIRCLLLFDPQRPPLQGAINWIIKKHRWRQVGVAESLANSHTRFKNHPFVILSYPDQSIHETVKAVAKSYPFWIVESIALALCYSAPLICFEEEVFMALNPFLTWILRAENLPESEVLRHLRIAGYVPIDFFPQVKEHFLILKKGGEELKKVIKKRKKEAESDGKKRFWRIKGKQEEKPFIGYIDLMPALSNVRDILQNEFIGLLLSITTVIYLSFDK